MKNNWMIRLIAILVFLFLMIPLLIIVVTSFGEASAIQFPISSFTFDWYKVVFESEAFISSFYVSLGVGLAATLLAIIIGVPAAYLLARYSSKTNAFLNDFFLSPTLIPGMVMGYAIFQLVVVKFQWSVLTSLVIGHLIISLPYVIRLVGSSLQNLDYSIEEAAWTLGYTKFQAITKIVLPNISSGIFAAFMLAFINSFNNIPVSMFLTGPGVTTLPITILNYMEFNYNPAVSAISTLLMLLTVVLMYLIDKTLGLSSIV
ncbi:ABC transporter permease [Globicatella sanguinis]|uniref:ABC transporter permease n=1 Tax=Globicatella sanguinis TaxID=13076 RepID=UPI000C7BBABA|nr:ABC transporter permease [Globicatella sanguinis]MDK7630695.1 ABC transporter permease [Globicatella sanguinis]WIK66017.1 ABC transporter permease [Globicatella sanguinis]WKT55422.1 ABC transporter permease [Globicatella sanguinis]